ncbi:MAG TPA: hypothetical protein VFK41_03115 [Nocardioidaceae bacterium]|nr:hypothetical protein [Nocardioidaceae bacterium]
MYEHGRLQEVQIVTFGSELSADTAAGAMTLVVEDAADFDENGGSLVINDQVIVYTACDDDTGTLTLAAALAADAEEGDRVKLYDPLYLTVVTSKVAQVKVDGDLDDADPIEAVIAMHLVDQLDEGIRGLRGESVLLELDDDEWRVVDVLGFGDPNAGVGVRSKIDSFTVTATGDQTLVLTFTPTFESDHVYWNGVEQQGQYSISGNIVTIPDPDGIIQVGDALDVKYDYRGAPVSPSAFGITGSTSDKSATAGVSLEIPIGDHEAGDLLILAVGRRTDTAAPSGWTLEQTHPYDVGAIKVYSRVATGAEESVTITAGGSDYMAGICVVVAGASEVVGATTDVEDPASSPYSPPAVAGDTQITFVAVDGPSAVSEFFSAVGGTSLANLNMNSGLWGFAAAEGSSSSFTLNATDPTVYVSSITVGVS